MISELPSDRSFIVFLDCDNTLVKSDGSWPALHREFNTETFRDRQLARYSGNKITFEEWTFSTAKKWKGNNITAVGDAFHSVNLINDYKRTVAKIKSLDGIVGIVSAGVEQFVGLVGQEANVDFVIGNSLGVADGKFDGNIDINVTDQGKSEVYQDIVNCTSLPTENAVMLGDSIYDIQKLHHNNLSIAFNPNGGQISEEADTVIHDDSLHRIVPPIKQWIAEDGLM